MKRFLILSAIVLLLVQCSNEEKKADSKGNPSTSITQQATSFQSVSAQTGKMLLENKKNMVLLDVRTPQEVRRFGTIKGGKLVPFRVIMQNTLDISTDTPILIFCAVGGRSYFAGQVLARNGYKEVYNLKGGIDAWKKAGYPVI